MTASATSDSMPVNRRSTMVASTVGMSVRLVRHPSSTWAGIDGPKPAGGAFDTVTDATDGPVAVSRDERSLTLSAFRLRRIGDDPMV